MSEMKLTQAQRRVLTDLTNATEPCGMWKLGTSHALMDKLRDQGLAKREMRGGYSITDAGRAALSQPQ